MRSGEKFAVAYSTKFYYFPPSFRANFAYPSTQISNQQRLHVTDALSLLRKLLRAGPLGNCMSQRLIAAYLTCGQPSHLVNRIGDVAVEMRIAMDWAS